MARVGEKLGRYELLEQLGKGAAGTVFRARDSLLGIDVCVKILHSGLATQPGIIERFKRELLLARRIAHPGICKIFDIQQSGDTHFLTMEYVKGETLSTILNRDGQMAAKDAVRLMRKVSEALGAAHKAGVVHRDIKPGNIIIGEGERVTIVDFGVATAEDLDRLTRAGVVLGSRSYMAPETWQGKPATAAGDVWALGVILYGCVTGRLPYKGEGVIGVFEAIKSTKPVPPSAINAEVTPALEELIFKAMSVDVEQRFADATAVESALATLELTLGDDETVVRAPAFAKPSPSSKPSSTGASGPSAAAPDVAASQEPAGDGRLGAAGRPSPPSERLHRPSAQPLPRPPSSALPPSSLLPATKELSRTPPKSTEEISVIGDEMSLYAPNEPSLSAGSLPSSEQQDPTRVVGPFPDLVRKEEVSAENVAAAFDAAFGIVAPPSSDAALPSPPPTSPGPDVHEPATVIATVPPDFGAPLDAREEPPASAAGGADLAAALGEPSLLDFTAPPANDPSPDGLASPPADALSSLVGRDLGEGPDLGQDHTAVTEAPASLFAPASDESFFATPPGEATRIEPPPAADEPVAALADEAVSTPRATLLDDVGTVRARPDKRVLAAVAAVALVLVVAIVALVAGGGDETDAVAAADPAAVAQAANAGGGEAWVFPEENGAAAPAAKAADADVQGQEEEVAAVPDGQADSPGENAAAATDEVADDVVEEAALEPAAVADEGDDVAGDEAEQAGAGASDEALDDPELDDAEPGESEIAAADDGEPAVSEPAPRKQRASAQSIAKGKYKRKRAALNSALARKGILPGDVAAVDGKRRAMTQAARRRDYGRAADAAEDAMRELAKVKIDAGFVGKKLARFNKGYDRTKDEALRNKLKGVLKEVGADYSKGRYDEANKKLNRAFSLMRR